MFQTLDSRKYVDLIYKAESKFANWDPAERINAGDFGTLNSDTGKFEKVGNIYDKTLRVEKDGTIHEDTIVPNVEVDYPLIKDDIVNSQYVHSSREKECTVEGNLNASLEGIANVNTSLKINFSQKRYALLVMHQLTATRIPNKFLDISTKIECLQGKMLVTKVVTCPGYVRYLSAQSSQSGSIEVTLTATGAPASGGSKFQWKTGVSSGNLQESYDKDLAYTPLFYAKTIKKPLWLLGGRRGEISPDEPQDDYWEDATVPWSTLDDEGRELKGRYRPRTGRK